MTTKRSFASIIHRLVGGVILSAGMLLWIPAQAMGPIVNASELQGLAGKPNLKILDIRETKGSPQAPNYEAGHIPGSVSAPYSSFRGDTSNPGQLIPEAKLSALLSKLGITPETQIVVTNRGTDPTDFGAAARVYWTLKVSGFKHLAILDGGLKAWTTAGYSLTVEKPTIKPSALTLQYDQSAIVTLDDVSKSIQATAPTKPKLIDARPTGFFKGEVRHDAASRYGTLPTATNLSHDQWFVPKTGQLKSKADIEAIAKATGLIQDQETVSFCNTGHWAHQLVHLVRDPGSKGRKNVSRIHGGLESDQPASSERSRSRGNALAGHQKSLLIKTPIFRRLRNRVESGIVAPKEEEWKPCLFQLVL